MWKAAAIADDLTGALETGALLAAGGFQTWVTTSWSAPSDWPAADALVVDTETRSTAAAEAAHRVGSVFAAMRTAGVTRIYKKTDSTLRGPWAAELTALAKVSPVIFAPAYPRLGRTLRGGMLLVNGVAVSETAFAKDPRDPVRESSVLQLLPGARLMSDPGGLRSLRPGEVAVGDAESDADLAALAEMARMSPAAICAGSGGFASHWVRLLASPGHALPPRPSLRDPLLVCGSRHPASLRQAENARALGIPVVMPKAGGNESPARVAEQLAGVAARRSAGTWILFGGDTAYAVLAQLGERHLEALGELMPGVPLSRTPAGCLVVTKAGGFGDDDLIARILKGDS